MERTMSIAYRHLSRSGAAVIALMRPVRHLRHLRQVLGSLPRWQERAQERRHLMALDDRLLKDIGVSRLDAWQEFNKPFWRP